MSLFSLSVGRQKFTCFDFTMHFNLGVESFYVRPLLLWISLKREYMLCGACSTGRRFVPYRHTVSIWVTSFTLHRATIFTMELNCFRLTNVRCSLSGEWPNILHSPTPPCNSLYVSMFTWCHFYYNSGEHSVGCYLPMHFNLPWCHFYYKCSMLSINLCDTFARPLRYAGRMQGYTHGCNMASSHHITTDIIWTRSNI